MVKCELVNLSFNNLNILCLVGKHCGTSSFGIFTKFGSKYSGCPEFEINLSFPSCAPFLSVTVFCHWSTYLHKTYPFFLCIDLFLPPQHTCLTWLFLFADCKCIKFIFHSYRQAQATVLEALPKLQKHNIPTKRPEDYFAEMTKTDQHMQKVCPHVVLTYQ